MLIGKCFVGQVLRALGDYLVDSWALISGTIPGGLVYQLVSAAHYIGAGTRIFRVVIRLKTVVESHDCGIGLSVFRS